MYFFYNLLFYICLSLFSPFATAQQSATRPLPFYLTNLISAGKNINSFNYEKVVYQKICPYMESLQLIESKQKINQTTRKQILEEVVQIYDKALNFSSEHYLMYCLYNYYSSTKSSNEIWTITQKILSPQTCFCSDFCRGRTQYVEPHFKVQAVFQWNPEIIEYAKQIE